MKTRVERTEGDQNEEEHAPAESAPRGGGNNHQEKRRVATSEFSRYSSERHREDSTEPLCRGIVKTELKRFKIADLGRRLFPHNR